jgi:hypothetical protein
MLPVVCRKIEAAIVNDSIQNSYLWQLFKCLTLTDNMQVLCATKKIGFHCGFGLSLIQQAFMVASSCQTFYSNLTIMITLVFTSALHHYYAKPSMSLLHLLVMQSSRYRTQLFKNLIRQCYNACWASYK